MKDIVKLVETQTDHNHDNTQITTLYIQWTCSSCGDKIYANSGIEKCYTVEKGHIVCEIWNGHRVPINYMYCPCCNLEAEIWLDANENLEMVRIYNPDEDINTNYENEEE